MVVLCKNFSLFVSLQDFTIQVFLISLTQNVLDITHFKFPFFIVYSHVVDVISVL